MEKAKKFFGLLSSDFLKLSKMKSVYIGIGVMAFLTLIFALAQNALTSFIQEYPADGGTLDPDTVEGLTGTFVFTLLNAAPSSTGVFFLLPIIAALFIGTDFSSGMMRLYIGRGVQKTELYLSKFIVITSVSVLYVCLAFAMCGIAAAATDMSAELSDYVFSYTPSAFGSYIALAFVMAAICTSVSFLLRSKAGSMAALLVMLIFLGDILVMVVQIALAMLTTGTDVTGNFVYMLFNPYYCADAFASAYAFTAKEAGIAFGGCAMWFVLFTAAGLFATAKRDVK